MNSPQQQAELYRKAAETIEMCAKHGIEPKCKYLKSHSRIEGMTLIDNFEHYEYPIAVIEGQLVWADTVVYNPHWINGVPAHVCSFTQNNDASWSLTPPKRTVMVELTVEDAELHSNIYTRLGLACSKAINVYK